MNCIPLVSLSLLALSLPAQQKLPVAEPAKPADAREQFECGSRVELRKVWAMLKEQHDADGDSKVTKAEYTRGDVRFANYDRDGDGVLTEKDFPAGAFVNGFNSWLVRMADGDRDGAVTTEEWRAFGAELDADGDGVVGPAELAKKMGPAAAAKFDLFLLSFDQDWDGKFTAADLKLAFADLDVDGDGVLKGKETERWKATSARPRTPLPKVGAAASDFDLPRADDAEQRFVLSSFAGKRPVALIFGSYT